MARNITDTNRRDAEILLAALNLIKDNGGSKNMRQLKKSCQNILALSIANSNMLKMK